MLLWFFGINSVRALFDIRHAAGTDPPTRTRAEDFGHAKVGLNHPA